MLYGVSPFKEVYNQLKPVMSFFGPVVLIKKIKKGSSIGYNQVYTATKNLKTVLSE